MQSLECNVMPPRSFVPAEEKRNMVEILLGLGQEMLPDSYGFYEPVRKPFTPECVEDAVLGWRRSLLWVRKKPHVDGVAWSSWGNTKRTHGAISLRAREGTNLVGQFVEFVIHTASAFEADLGYIHVNFEPDIEIG